MRLAHALSAVMLSDWSTAVAITPNCSDGGFFQSKLLEHESMRSLAIQEI